MSIHSAAVSSSAIVTAPHSDLFDWQVLTILLHVGPDLGYEESQLLQISAKLQSEDWWSMVSPPGCSMQTGDGGWAAGADSACGVRTAAKGTGANHGQSSGHSRAIFHWILHCLGSSQWHPGYGITISKVVESSVRNSMACSTSMQSHLFHLGLLPHSLHAAPLNSPH